MTSFFQDGTPGVSKKPSEASFIDQSPYAFLRKTPLGSVATPEAVSAPKFAAKAALAAIVATVATNEPVVQ